MRSAAEYRAYAEQCVERAKTARSDAERDALLDMARTWLEAARNSDEMRLARVIPRQS